jgi:hypothetical protein
MRGGSADRVWAVWRVLYSVGRNCHDALTRTGNCLEHRFDIIIRQASSARLKNTDTKAIAIRNK